MIDLREEDMKYTRNKTMIERRDEYIVIRIMKQGIKKKLDILDVIEMLSYFIAIFSLFLLVSFLATSNYNNALRFIFVLGWLAMFMILHMILEKIFRIMRNNLKMPKSSYASIYRFQVLPSTEDVEFVNGDDLVWCVGILFPLYTPGFSKHVLSKLDLNGYKPSRMGYVSADDRTFYGSTVMERAHIPVIITVNGVIYPFIDPKYYFDTDYITRPEADRFLWHTNRKYNLPNQPDYAGRTEPYDLVTDIGYIILKSELGLAFTGNRKPIEKSASDDLYI